MSKREIGELGERKRYAEFIKCSRWDDRQQFCREQRLKCGCLEYARRIIRERKAIESAPPDV